MLSSLFTILLGNVGETRQATNNPLLYFTMRFSHVKFVALVMGLLAENGVAFSTSRLLAARKASQSGRNDPVAFIGRPRSLLVVDLSLAMTAAPTATTTAGGFIESELRGAAMRLHTREQAPKEGQVEVKHKPKDPYVPTRDDYLAFLVDSKHVYEALEDIVNNKEELAMFRNTGLERTEGLEKDIQFMVQEYGLERPPVGNYGKVYATEIREIADKNCIPEFMCHFYNFYFAHTAGGRMIGKQMSALLLNKKTLEFYKASFLMILF